MTRTQLENIYNANELNDYRLKNTEDLLKVHGIDYKKVKGYEDLEDFNKEIYEKFIIKIFNSWSFDSRALLIPKAIYWVEDIEYIVKDQDSLYVAAKVIYSIDKNGKRKILREWEDIDYTGFEKIEDEPEFYLRFEYESGTDSEGKPIKEWLHVIKEGNEWY